jgi:hypothetical protein
VKGIEATNTRATKPWIHHVMWWASSADDPLKPIEPNNFMSTQPTGDQSAKLWWDCASQNPSSRKPDTAKR